MDAINARIAALIRESGKTKTEWANRLKVTPQFISSLCNGKTRPSDRTIADICRVFSVREEWLRHGDEPMLAAPEPKSLDVMLQRRGMSERDMVMVRPIVEAFLELGEASRQEVIRFVESWVEKLNSSSASSTPKVDLAAKVEMLERQNRELMARLEAIEKEDPERELAELKRQNQEILRQNSEMAAEIAAINEEDSAVERAERMARSVSRFPSR